MAASLSPIQYLEFQMKQLRLSRFRNRGRFTRSPINTRAIYPRLFYLMIQLPTLWRLLENRAMFTQHCPMSLCQKRPEVFCPEEEVLRLRLFFFAIVDLCRLHKINDCEAL